MTRNLYEFRRSGSHIREVVGKVAPRGSRRREIALHQVVGFFTAMRSLEQHLLSGQYIVQENATLLQSWSGHTAEALDGYLVSGYQNPRINAQSILVRHFLLRKLFGDEFKALMRDELRFAVEANEAIGRRAKELGVTMGAFTSQAKRNTVAEVCSVIADREDTYERLWSEALAGRTAPKLRVLELACGSANDYRFFDSYGLAKFLDYTGVDLNETNIANARKRHPGVRFEHGSILKLPYESAAFDYVLAFDIFEHLSLQAMGYAMAEAVRVSRRGFLIAFFNMSEAGEHAERPREAYHWNELSAPQIQASMARRFASVDLVRMQQYLLDEFAFAGYYNPKAWSLFAEGRR